MSVRPPIRRPCSHPSTYPPTHPPIHLSIYLGIQYICPVLCWHLSVHLYTNRAIKIPVTLAIKVSCRMWHLVQTAIWPYYSSRDVAALSSCLQPRRVPIKLFPGNGTVPFVIWSYSSRSFQVNDLHIQLNSENIVPLVSWCVRLNRFRDLLWKLYVQSRICEVFLLNFYEYSIGSSWYCIKILLVVSYVR